MKILCIGPMWSGSNAGALFKALGRQGELISVIDEFYHIPLNSRTNATKVLNKLLRPFYITSFNKEIESKFETFKPDVVLVYKGAFVKPSTVETLMKTAKVVCFYPDVSFHTHGSLLKETLPLYETVFTTKTFGVNDMAEQLGQKNGVFIPHGFDPEVHRSISLSAKEIEHYACDASFIGTWSPHKEKHLSALVKALPNLDLKIWGNQWEKSGKLLRPFIKYRPVDGDQYAMAIQASKVNIALLSEQVKGASSGDKITSRTFHIPACGGFMIHQRTEELQEYFTEREVGMFSSQVEFVNQVSYYLANASEREEVMQSGYERNKENSIDQRAQTIINQIKKEK